MNKKQVIRINESHLRQIVSEAVKTVLKEGKSLPASENEFKQDRADLLRIMNHLKEFCKYTDSLEYDEGDRYRYALMVCIKCIDRAMQVMDKTLLFTAEYGKLPIHWWADNYDENGNIDYNIGRDFGEITGGFDAD